MAVACSDSSDPQRRFDVCECRYLGLHLARLVVHSLVHDLEGRDGGEALLSRLAVREVDNWTGVAGVQVSLPSPSKWSCESVKEVQS